MKPFTLYEKLVASHTVERLDAQHVLLYADLHIMNEYTSPQAFTGLHDKGRAVLRPLQQLAVVSHIIPTAPLPVGQRVIADPASSLLALNLRRNCARHGIRLYDTNDIDQGIEHIIAPEQGLVRPGMVILCGDSHTTTYGALGALGFGVGTSEVEHILATQTLVYRVARTMRVRIDGVLARGVSVKDLTLYLVARLGAQGARGYAVEFCGAAIDALSVEARMTLCNMAVEAGARAALIAPDQATRDYLRAHAAVFADGPLPALWDALRSDAGAAFDLEHVFDAGQVAPYVTWGTSPDQGMAVDACIPAAGDAQKALAYMGLAAGAPIAGLPIDRVFIGSCTNSRIEDMREAAAVVRKLGQKVAKSVKLALVVPGSGLVKEQAEREGLDKIFIAAGFEWREPGCSMCLAMNADRLEPGERCASTSNRNFEGRQGAGGRTHLVSPAMAAAAAVHGHFVDVRAFV